MHFGYKSTDFGQKITIYKFLKREVQKYGNFLL